ncbi:hypothetical protein BBF96_03570 [Anoxybacter fermentans]|uniref:MurNAc-LAA domain-containing protein n=1 Tax=Anoxybacter fermentans TaxID=1323375 RepID=A0A3S9SWB1_9FIRM|nr:N-acetylmuramoyl-L-alanine amidase [Anoxybacter fermentans]AZR72542.1 hypothetical protein BBF96_03570 [Anoxybacter fermentans]
MKRIICIDPGHGEPWPGAVFGDIKESEFCLDVGNFLSRELQRRGHIVVQTRYTSSAIVPGRLTEDLTRRAEIANQIEADIFLSLHFNSHPNHEANGVETWYFKHSTKGRYLAELIQNQLIKKFKMRNRGIKGSRGLIVLKKTLMPAVLIELGFITNPRDRNIMTASVYPERVACAIADGVEIF